MDPRTPDSPTLFSPKQRCFSLSEGNKVKECAIIMLHAVVKTPHLIASNQSKRLGYHPIMIDKPVDDKVEAASLTIERLEQRLIEERLTLNTQQLNMKVAYVLVEANYSDHGSESANTQLLKYLIDSFPEARIFATSSTPECLVAIKTNDELKSIITTEGKQACADITNIMNDDAEASRADRKLSL